MTIFNVVYIYPDDSLKPEISSFAKREDALHDLNETFKELKDQFTGYTRIDDTILFFDGEPEVTVAMLKIESSVLR